MLLLAVIALIVVGPQRLPEMARKAGRITRQARHAWQNLQSELQAELDAEHNRKIMEATASEPTDGKPGDEAGDDERPDRPD
ncbi:MAG: twin-arginine translocase TatA/TatE family subunit [Wenzhouxiangellaceae bacterium]|nr:twin-arginine translocase TatA/TatE family subunit [Wenzhouxiangellaceae bacterium]